MTEAVPSRSTSAPSALPSCLTDALTAAPGCPTGGEFRALTAYERLPRSCYALQVMDERWTPHLRGGEWAIIDPTDREPASGELFLVKVGSPTACNGYVMRIVQLTTRPFEGRHGPVMGWWAAHELEHPRAVTMLDGPMNELIRDKIIGRVVGVMT